MATYKITLAAAASEDLATYVELPAEYGDSIVASKDCGSQLLRIVVVSSVATTGEIEVAFSTPTTTGDQVIRRDRLEFDATVLLRTGRDAVSGDYIAAVVGPNGNDKIDLLGFGPILQLPPTTGQSITERPATRVYIGKPNVALATTLTCYVTVSRAL